MNARLEGAARLAFEARALLEDFAAHVDTGANVSAMFSDDAVFTTPRGEIRGAEAIAQLFAANARQRASAGRISRHFVHSVSVAESDNGALNVRSTLVAIASDPSQNGAGSMLVGDQTDVLVRAPDGALKFSRREMTPVMEFALAPPKIESK